MASSPTLEMHDRISLGAGKVKDTLVLGVSPEYRVVRNLIITNGRFFDDQDAGTHAKVALVAILVVYHLYCGKLMLDSRAAMLKGGVSGPAIEPGKPENSILIELIHFNEMPPKNVKIRVTKDELQVLRAWIAAGASDK